MTVQEINGELWDFQFTSKFSILFVLLVTVLAKLLPVYFKWNRLRVKCDKIVGPKQWPILGNAPELAYKSTFGALTNRF
jgi:hypothetical protein